MAARLRILHLEDSPRDADLVRCTLEAGGLECDVVHVKNGEQFEAAFGADGFDVILSDYSLPHYNGFSALDFARRRAPEVPFILLSGTLGEELAVESLKTGATDYILKGRLNRLGPAVLRAVREAKERGERRRAEEALRATDEMLGHLLAHSSAVIYGLKVEGDTVVPNVVSENITDLLGFRVEETLRNEWWAEQLHPEDRARALESISETLSKNGSRSEYRVRHKDGSYRWVEDNRRLIHDSTNRQKEIVGVWTDVTERKKLEAEVALRELRLNAFFSNATAGLCILDDELRFVRVNETLAEINRTPAADHLGKRVREVLPSVAPLLEPILLKVLTTGEPVSNLEISGEIPAEPGVIHHWMVSHFRMTSEAGKPATLGSVVVEVTQRKRAEEALAQRTQISNLGADVGLALTQRESLSDTLQHCVERMVAHLGAVFARIWILNEKENVLELHVSAGLYSHIDGPHGRVRVGESKIGMIAQERRPQFINEVIGDPRVPDQEWARRERLVSFAGYPLIVADRLVGVLAMFARKPLSEAILTGLKSVSDAIALGIMRKRTEETMRENEERYRRLVELSPDAIFIESEGEFVFLNSMAAKLFGASDPRHLLGKKIVEFIHADFHELAPELFEGTQTKDQSAPVREMKLLRTDGTALQAEIAAAPLTFHGGRATQVVVRDITERKQLEDQLRQGQKMEAIGQLAGGIAHDFNNMLGCIMGYTEFAAMDPATTTEVKENLQEVIKASHRAKELVKQILTFSRQEDQQRSAIEIKLIVKEALKLLRASLPSTIQIQADLDSETGLVLADATQIHQIIMNLATNAAHAMSRRPGLLGIKLATINVDRDFARGQPDLRVGRYLRLDVSDTGCGMDGATLERIFEPFFTTKAPGEGTGLGLSVVHGIMKSHGGAITVSSEPGKGTTFQLYFPAEGNSSTEMARKLTTIPRGKGERILFVDDEAPLALLGKRMLERAGYSVTAYTSSLEALAAFREEPSSYDLVITDLTMPNLTGDDLAREVLKLRSELPIVVASGFGGAMDAAKAEALGIRQVVMKPVTAQSLHEAAYRALTGSKPT